LYTAYMKRIYKNVMLFYDTNVIGNVFIMPLSFRRGAGGEAYAR
jgi:hypothetical protein